jgi:hypothetical protein
MADVTSSKPLQKHLVFPFYPYQKGTPLQVVRWSGTRVAVVSGAAGSAELALPSTSLIEITATENIYIRFGNTGMDVATTTVATDGSRLFMAGVQVTPVPLDSNGNPYDYFSVIRAASTNGVVQIEAVE